MSWAYVAPVIINHSNQLQCTIYQMFSSLNLYVCLWLKIYVLNLYIVEYSNKVLSLYDMI